VAALGVWDRQGRGASADRPHGTASQAVHEVKVEFERRIPMRDGVTLSADVYLPRTKSRVPVILSRTPYLKTPRDKDILERLRYCDGMVRDRFREGLERPSPIQPDRVYAGVIDCWSKSQVFK
jgi:hypothetical protein